MLACVCAASLLLHAGGRLAAAQEAGERRTDLPLEDDSLEQLSDIVVTAVSRQPGRLASAPAAVCVISGAGIARSGATTLPEALRLAPDLQVVFASAREYAISACGDLAPGLAADLLLRRVARLPQPAVPGYHELDARIAWQARPGVELALAGRNLLHAHHPEFGTAGMRQLAERGVFASVSLRF